MTKALSVAFGFLGAAAMACGASQSSDTTFSVDGGANPASNDGGIVLGSTGADGGAGSTTFPDGCRAVSARAKVVPLHVVTLIDRSTSMGASYTAGDGSTTNRLRAVLDAIKQYATVLQPSPVLLSAIPFSQGEDACNAGSYQSLFVDVALPESAQTGAALDGVAMVAGTPTATAVQAGATLATSIRAGNPSHNVVLVLATDGEPSTCGMMQGAIDAVTAAAAQHFPTYVIGVGSNLSNLNGLAAAGGTNTALLIEGTAASDVGAKIRDRLESIRSQFSCELAIPATQPDGTAVKLGELNVQLTTSSGAQGLVYSQDCAVPGAFRYDMPAAPSKVVLCPSSCSSARADTSTTIELLFRCSTQVP